MRFIDFDACYVLTLLIFANSATISEIVSVFSKSIKDDYFLRQENFEFKKRLYPLLFVWMKALDLAIFVVTACPTLVNYYLQN